MKNQKNKPAQVDSNSDMKNALLDDRLQVPEQK